MIRLIFTFLILLGSVWLGVQLNRDQGYLLITFNQWTIETTLVVAIAAFIVTFLLLYMLFRALHYLSHASTFFQGWLEKRRIKKAQAKTRLGLKELNEGHWSQAKEHLLKGLPHSDVPLLNYLAAARAAQEMGENQLRDNYLQEAQRSIPEAKMAIRLTQAQLQLSNHQWDQAIVTLKQLENLSPKHPYVLKLLMQLYIDTHNWSQLIDLLPQLKRYKVISSEELEMLRHQAYFQKLKELSLSSDPHSLDQLVLNLPRPLNYDPDLMGVYCHFLILHQQDEKAEPILRRCLQKHPDENLISLYGQLNLKDKPLLFAEPLLKQHPKSAALYLCVGRLCLKNKLWGKAKEYLEKSIEIQPTPEAYAELGNLLQTLNDERNACKAFHQGLELANVKVELIKKSSTVH